MISIPLSGQSAGTRRSSKAAGSWVRRRRVFLAIEALEDRTLLSNYFTAVADSLDTKLAALQTGIDTVLNNVASVPFVGHAVGDLDAVHFIDNVRPQLHSALQQLGSADDGPSDDQIQKVLFAALGPDGGAKILGSLTGGGVPGLSDISVTHPGGVGGRIEVYLQRDLPSASTAVDFNTGLPSLPFRVDADAKGKVTVGVGVAYELAFHYDASGATSFDTTAKLNHFNANRPASEMTVTVDASLPHSFSATIGFLHGSITNLGDGQGQAEADQTRFVGTFGLDNLDDPQSATLEGRADANLRLSGGFGPTAQFPAIGADFHLHWQFAAGDPNANPPQVSFDNAGLDLGGFLSGLLKPILSKIQDATAPLQTPISILNTAIPVLSDLSHLLNQGDVTLLGMAKVVAGKSEYGPLVNLVSTVATLVQDFDSFKLDSGEITIPLGGFDLNQYDLRTNPNNPNDPTKTPAAGDISDFSLASVTNLVPENAVDLDINSIVNNTSLPPGAKDILSRLTQPDGINFQFPILDHPASAVFGLLLGRDSDLASFSADFHLKTAPDYGGGVSLFGVDVGFGGSVAIDAHFHFAYDTFGLRELIRDIGSGGGNLAADVTDGFYIDTSSYLSIGASVGVHAGATVLVFSANIGGGVSTADASGSGLDHPAVISFVDPNGNGHGHGTGAGKLRFADFTPCSVTTAGELDASLTVELKVGVTILGTFVGYSISNDIARVKLLDLNYACGNPPSPPPAPVLASAADEFGAVTLYVGSPYAGWRYLPDATAEHHAIPGTNNPYGEDYTISHVSGDGVSGETIRVTAFGQSQVISGVKRIVCNDDDQGDLTINIQAGVDSGAELRGGLGHADFTYSGQGAAYLYAGKMNSTLRGGYSFNRMKGGPGNDTIIGTLSFGNEIDGGGGDNTIIVSAPQIATIVGGTDPDTYTTLELVEPRGDEVTSVLPRDGGIGVFVDRLDGSAPYSIFVNNVSRLILDPGLGNNTVTVGDLSETGLQSLDVDVTHPDAYGGNHVTIAQSPGTDQLNMYPLTDPVSQQLTCVMSLDHTESSGAVNSLGIKIAGLVATDTLTLDGGGGTNVFGLFMSPDVQFDISVQDTGPAADDTVHLLGGGLPSGSLDVSDSAVTYSYLVAHPGFVSLEQQQVKLDQNLRNLQVDCSNGDETVTANRSFGTTVIVGGVGRVDFEVSGQSQYLLYGRGVSDFYNVSLDRFSAGITIVGNSSGLSETLVVDDSKFQTGQGTKYALSSTGLTREEHLSLPGNLNITITCLVNYTSMGSVTLDTGPGLLAPTAITVNGTPAGTRTAINAAEGTNSLDIEATAPGSVTAFNAGSGLTDVAIGRLWQSLARIAGPVSISGNVNTSMIVDDRATFAYFSSYLLSDQTLNYHANLFDPLTQVISNASALITYHNLGWLTVYTDAAPLANNQVRVLGTVGYATTLSTGTSRSQVTASDGNTRLDGITNLVVLGGSGTSLVLDDTGASNTKEEDPYDDGGSHHGLWEVKTYQTSPTFVVRDQNVARSDRSTSTDDLEDAYGGTIVGSVSPSITSFSNSSITYRNVASLVIKGGGSDNIFNVLGTAQETPTAINVGLGNDTINVGDANTDLDGIGTLTVNGNALTVLTLDDQFNHDRRYEDAYNDGGDHLGLVEIQTFETSPTYRITSQNVTRANQVTYRDSVVDADNQTTTPLPGSPSTYFLTASISFPNVGRVAIKGGSTRNIFDVQSATAATPITISTGGGGDTVKVGNPDDGLIEGIEFLAVHGNTGTTLSLDDQANAAVTLKGAREFDDYTRETSPNYQVTDHVVTRTDRVIERDPDSSTGPDLESYAIVSDAIYQSLISYDGIANLVINSGSSADHFNVESTASGTNTTINSNGGQDVINAGGSARSLDRLLGSLTVNGGRGASTLNLYDQSNTDGIDPSFAEPTFVTTRPTYVITDSSVTRDNALTYTTVATGAMSAATVVGTIAFSQLSALNLYGGSSGNVFYVQSTAPGIPLSVNAALNDRVGISSLATTLDDIQGPVRINGTGNVNVSLDDSHSTVGHAYTFTSDTVISSLVRSGSAPISYSGTSALGLVGGHGDDTFDFESIGVFTSIYGGGGNDTFLVSPIAHNLDNLPPITPISSGLPSLFLHGTGPGPTGGTANLVVNDQANPIGATWSITDSALVRIRPATPDRIMTQVYYQDFNSLAVNAGSGDDMITSSVDLPSPFTLTIDGGGGNDTITDPGEGTTLLGGPGNDTIIVTATTGSGVHVDGGDGTDNLTVYLGSLLGPVTIADSGTPGSDSVTVLGASGDNAINFAGNQVQSGSQTIILDSPLASLTVVGDVGATAITVNAPTVPVASLALVGGTGTNNFTIQNLGASPVGSLTVVGASDPSLNHIEVIGGLPPQVNLQHFAPTVAAIADRAFPQGTTWSLAGSFSDQDTDETWTASVNYGDGQGCLPLALAADKTFLLSQAYAENGLYSVTIAVRDSRGGVGSASFQVTAVNVAPTASIAGAADGVRGQVRTLTVAAADPSPGDTSAGFSYLIDWGDGSPGQSVAATPNNGAGILLNHVFTGEGAYTVSVTATDRNGGVGPAATQNVAIEVAAIQTDWLDPTKNVLVVGGSTGDDKIKLTPGDNPGDMKVKIHDEEHFRYRASLDPPLARIVVYGQAGDDDITVSNDITIPAWLYGQDGNDRLRGGGGPSVLLGGGGDDVLAGAGGRDLLIGGTGSDKISGDASDDILISGYTAYDANDAALAAVMAEWTSARSYTDRISNLRGDTSSPTFALRVNGDVYLAVDGTCGRTVTAFDDGAVDVLTGGDGLDWFLFNADGDNQAKKDKVTDLNSSEFADDLDFINGGG